MSESGPGGPSFDPRTWRRSGGDAAETSASSEASYDLKSWRAPKRAAGPAAKTSSGGVVVMAVVVLVVLIAAGAGFALWTVRHSAHTRGAPGTTVAGGPAHPSGPAAERRSLTLASAQDLPNALAGAGASPADAQAAAQSAEAALGAVAGELKLSLNLTPAGATPLLARLELRRDDGTGVVVTRQPDGRFLAKTVGADLVTQVKVVRSQMDEDSFYSSAVSAGVTDDLIPSFLQAFAYDFDFQREIKQGDVFEAVFQQQVDPTGAPVGQDQLLFASLETDAKQVQLYWFTPAGKQGGWYDGNGRSVVRSLMRTPVVGARISSPFGMRMHPVLGFEKMHNGTDFAAVVGTPIYAAGDGIVEFAGMKGPNGNFTKILHPNGWETLYLHQSLILPNIVQGVHVTQSEEIGEVGATGVDSAGRSTVTGPHLHYEVHINNLPVDPMSIPVDAGMMLQGADYTAFIKERNRIDGLRSAQGG